MIFIREFEFCKDKEDGAMLAIPCDMEGATFGDDLQDAVKSASDWLYETAFSAMAKGEQIPGGKLGHEPLSGGRVIAVSVNCDLSSADAVTAADAARMLGVSTARIAQMCESGKLLSWRDGTRRMVSRESVKARLENTPKAGRPRKNTELLQA